MNNGAADTHTKRSVGNRSVADELLGLTGRLLLTANLQHRNMPPKVSGFEPDVGSGHVCLHLVPYICLSISLEVVG